MPRRTTYQGDNRFDSAFDLSHGHRHASHDHDSEHTRPLVASSVMEPWSQYNPRLEVDHVSSYAPSDWSPLPQACDNADTIAYQTQVLGSGFSPDTPYLPYISPETATHLTRSPSTSSSPPLPVGHYPSASGPARLPISQRFSNNVTTCRQCAQDFTGKYGAGNCARHFRLKHAGEDNTLYKCNASNCDKVYRRKDARLKHERRKHPELHLSPALARRGIDHHPTISSARHNAAIVHDLSYNVGQWLPTDHASVGSQTCKEQDPCTLVERTHHAAHYIITTLQEELHPGDYLRSFDAFFIRWECIVQQMLQKQSEAFPVYARVLDDIRCAVYTIEIAARGNCIESGGNGIRASQKDRAAPRGNGNLGLGSSTLTTPSVSRVTKRGGRKLSLADESDKSVLVALEELDNKGSRNEVDCPVYKHHFMHRTPPPCRGCRVRVMSQIRSHLNPDRAGTHRGFPRFVMQCHRCKQDFVQREAYDNHTNANSCTFQRQQRGDIIFSWGRQYLALYPNASRIPLPWPGETGWLPDWVLAQCRVPRVDSTASGHFLDEHQGRSELRPQTQSVMMDQSDDPDHTAAMGHMLHDLVNPEYVQSSHFSTPAHNSSRQSTASLQPPFNGSVGRNNQYWQSILDSLGRHQRTIRHAAPYLDREQLRYMATQSESILAISRGLYQQHQAMPMLIEADSPDHGDFVLGDNSTMYTTPSQPRLSRGTSHDHFDMPETGDPDEIPTPSTGTLAGTPSHGYWSPQDSGSTPTNPSSNYAPNNPSFLSSYSPLQYRGTSLPSEFNEDATRSRRDYASRMSLQEDCINPTLLNSTSGASDDVIYHEYMHPYPSDDS